MTFELDGLRVGLVELRRVLDRLGWIDGNSDVDVFWALDNLLPSELLELARAVRRARVSGVV